VCSSFQLDVCFGLSMICTLVESCVFCVVWCGGCECGAEMCVLYVVCGVFGGFLCYGGWGSVCGVLWRGMCVVCHQVCCVWVWV